jgi:hypothetical protein
MIWTFIYALDNCALRLLGLLAEQCCASRSFEDFADVLARLCTAFDVPDGANLVCSLLSL